MSFNQDPSWANVSYPWLVLGVTYGGVEGRRCGAEGEPKGGYFNPIFAVMNGLPVMPIYEAPYPFTGSGETTPPGADRKPQGPSRRPLTQLETTMTRCTACVCV